MLRCEEARIREGRGEKRGNEMARRDNVRECRKVKIIKWKREEGKGSGESGGTKLKREKEREKRQVRKGGMTEEKEEEEREKEVCRGEVWREEE